EVEFSRRHLGFVLLVTAWVATVITTSVAAQTDGRGTYSVRARYRHRRNGSSRPTEPERGRFWRSRDRRGAHDRQRCSRVAIWSAPRVRASREVTTSPRMGGF